WEIAARQGGFSVDLGRWESCARAAGFSAITSVPGDPRRRAAEAHGLVIARRELVEDRAQSPPPPPLALPDGADGGALAEELWRRLLGRTAAPAEASFFALGGDSLLAVQLLAELRVATGRHITTRQFTADPTLRGLKALLSSTEPAAALAAPPSPAPVAPDEAPRAPCDEASVRAFLAQYLDGLRRRDAASLREIFADDCVTVTTGESILVGA